MLWTRRTYDEEASAYVRATRTLHIVGLKQETTYVDEDNMRTMHRLSPGTSSVIYQGAPCPK